MDQPSAILKRVAAIHDISGVGKCSLSVISPILSAAGIECSLLPTAVLSTHSGGFTGNTYRDLSEDILPIARHWKKEDISFDALYSGFLGSAQQTTYVSEIFQLLSNESTVRIVDPVMADHGKMYSFFSHDKSKMIQAMRKLCSQAHILTPNITEAAFLLDIPFHEGPYTETYIRHLISGLCQLGAKNIVLTGVYTQDDRMGAACYDDETKQLEFCLTKRIPGFYHGTGDIFAAVLVAGYLRDCTLIESVQLAVQFTSDAISRTISSQIPFQSRMGINFEYSLPWLCQKLNPGRDWFPDTDNYTK